MVSRVLRTIRSSVPCRIPGFSSGMFSPVENQQEYASSLVECQQERSGGRTSYLCDSDLRRLPKPACHFERSEESAFAVFSVQRGGERLHEQWFLCGENRAQIEHQAVFFHSRNDGNPGGRPAQALLQLRRRVARAGDANHLAR